MIREDHANKRLVKAIEELKEGLQRVEQTKLLSPEALEQIRSAVQTQEETRDTVTSSRILKSLAFSTMLQRYNAITPAHAATFRWFFSDDTENPSSSSQPDNTTYESEACREAKIEAKKSFSNWLQSGNGVLHISGKLGSGKSTLMKFLADHPQTRSGLQAWARDKKLVFAAFYFWKAGSPEQRSFAGLLKSLLHNSLTADATLIPLIMPDVWKSARDSPHITPSITDDKILEAFTVLIQSTATLNNRCFCFFVDGLDEFEQTSQMDFRDIANGLNQWTGNASTNFKLCVSSREENAFMNAFPKERRIRIHNLTEADMATFVFDRLSHVTEAEDLRDLAWQIVRRSQGIFLWTALVVKEIRRRYENKDVENLHLLLDFFPHDLKALFRYILQDLIEDKKMAHATFSMLMYCQAWGVELHLWAFSFMTDYLENPNFIRHHPLKPSQDESAVLSRITDATFKVNGWCRGLVDFSDIQKRDHKSLPHDPGIGQVIRFSHRTIFDFFSSDETRPGDSPFTANINWDDAYTEINLAGRQSFQSFRTHISDLNPFFIRNRAASSLVAKVEPQFSEWEILDDSGWSHDVSRSIAAGLPRSSNTRSVTYHLGIARHKHDITYLIPPHSPEPMRDPRLLIPQPEDVGEDLQSAALTLTLLDGDSKYPAWRLQQDPKASECGFLVTFMCHAALYNSQTLQVSSSKGSLLSHSTFPNLQSILVRIGYQFLDFLAANHNFSSRLIPGLRLGHVAWDNKTAGVLGRYLTAWFLSHCKVERLLGKATVVLDVSRSTLPTEANERISRFGQVLERLFKIDKGRLRFEAHVKLATMDQTYMVQVRFHVGDIEQRPPFAAKVAIMDNSPSSSHRSPPDSTKSRPEVSTLKPWTLEDLIKNTNPPNRDILLQMIQGRNASLPTV